ncbi:MAG: tRNA lysidine(34) synthetase TilS, partial [Acidobacteria bacterium]|nr:tRNA lysidine(34) synthetase TilS [Acidobacteriota bacterium]
MPPGLPNRVLHCIRRHEFIRPGDRVGVAVSGGADSVALLRLLLELRSRLGVVVLALHVNHGLRGAESALDQALVTGLAAQLGVEAQVRTVDCRGCARQYGLSLEAAGRRLRYAAFAEIASECRLDCVATGHTLDDQAETVLLKLLRGAWTRGLAGIYPSVQKSGFRIVRPLLGIRRAELRQYLEALGQGWREDSTNADPAYLRN